MAEAHMSHSAQVTIHGRDGNCCQSESAGEREDNPPRTRAPA